MEYDDYLSTFENITDIAVTENVTDSSYYETENVTDSSYYETDTIVEEGALFDVVELIFLVFSIVTLPIYVLVIVWFVSILYMNAIQFQYDHISQGTEFNLLYVIDC
jgi:hypothetical protein